MINLLINNFCFSEVYKALNKTRGLYTRWAELQDITVITPKIGTDLLISHEELEWTTTEFRNALRSIEWDLEDLEDTIYILSFIELFTWQCKETITY